MLLEDKFREGQHTHLVKKKMMTLMIEMTKLKMMRMKKQKGTGINDNDNIDEDTARMEKYLRLYFHSLAKSGTIRIMEEEFNLVTAKLFQVFKC